MHIQLSKINRTILPVLEPKAQNKKPLLRDFLFSTLFPSLSPQSSKLSPVFNGGGERDRTDDLLRARQALSQLSYTPIS